MWYQFQIRRHRRPRWLSPPDTRYTRYPLHAGSLSTISLSTSPQSVSKRCTTMSPTPCIPSCTSTCSPASSCSRQRRRQKVPCRIFQARETEHVPIFNVLCHLYYSLIMSPSRNIRWTHLSLSQLSRLDLNAVVVACPVVSEQYHFLAVL